MGWGFDIPGTTVHIGEEGITGLPTVEVPNLGGRIPNPFERTDEENRARASRNTLQGLRDRAKKLAADYRQNLPSYQKGLIDVAYKSNRSQLAERMRDQTTALASRGLVSGGIAQGAAAKSAAKADAEFAGQQNEIAKQVADQADEFDKSVANIGLNLANYDANQQGEYFRSALENMQRRQQALGSLGQAGGQLIGRYMAGRNTGNGGYEFDEVAGG